MNIQTVPKLVNGSWVGQVGRLGPVDSCGQVGDLDPSLVNSHNLSRAGQVRPVDSCGRVKMTSLAWMCFHDISERDLPFSIGVGDGDRDHHLRFRSF